ncbi:hypothetical protein LTR04_003863 [Oleoguttula sp. CCFEE 6159]|nr:hypothetical protein LTR04_003863 [Oleoguttula sp. CCFEE 6159]
MQQASPSNYQQNQQFGGPLFDPSDSAILNLDIASLNYGNQYSGIGIRQGSSNQLYNQQLADVDLSADQYGHNGLPHAYATEAGPNSLTSANSDSNEVVTGYDSTPMSPTFFVNTSQQQQHHQQPQLAIDLSSPQLQKSRKRRQDTSQVYSSVQALYSYTTGFHSLAAFLQKRFSSQKTIRIAKALASIRSCFISCTKPLNRDDLILTEKYFQRTLWEYEHLINAYGTPTAICRRTGGIAAVNKEFSILTGWRRDVLFGQEPNLNVNIGGMSANQTRVSSRDINTPRVPNANLEASGGDGRPQPIFLAELLDDDSVIQFYEDFARLAFGASCDSVITTCKLTKYKTKEDRGWGPPDQSDSKNDQSGGDVGTRHSNGQQHFVKVKLDNVGIMNREAGINTLGDKEGEVECMFCWTVKRDVFDTPMLVVMNVSVPHARSQHDLKDTS